MLRRHIDNLIYILPKPIVFFSTGAITDKENKPIPLIEKLREEFSDIAPISNTLMKDEFKNIHFNEWKSRIDVMKNYQFSESECFKMISRYPSLLKIPLDKFETTTQRWYYADLGVKYFRLVLLNQPVLFEIERKIIESRLPILRSHFRSSDALAVLLMNSPNIMYDQWDTVLIKLNYLLKERKFKMGEVMQSCALSKPLDFIKLRLDLLEKCGIFKQETQSVHKINKYDKSKHKNPVLKDILLTNVEGFTKIAKISSEEYAVFRDFFMLNSGEADDDDDDDDDNDGDVNNNDDDLKSSYNRH